MTGLSLTQRRHLEGATLAVAFLLTLDSKSYDVLEARLRNRSIIRHYPELGSRALACGRLDGREKLFLWDFLHAYGS